MDMDIPHPQNFPHFQIPLSRYTTQFRTTPMTDISTMNALSQLHATDKRARAAARLLRSHHVQAPSMEECDEDKLLKSNKGMLGKLKTLK